MAARGANRPGCHGKEVCAEVAGGSPTTSGSRGQIPAKLAGLEEAKFHRTSLSDEVKEWEAAPSLETPNLK